MRVTRSLFNSLEHVDTLIALGEPGSGHQPAESAFALAGLARRVAVAVPSFVAAAMTAAHTDLADTLPRGVAHVLATHLPIALVELPVRGFGVPVGLVWHVRTGSDALCHECADPSVAPLVNRPRLWPS